MKKFFQKNEGYTLAEMLIYIGILAFISLVVVSMLLSFSQTYKAVTALRVAETSGIYGMDRMIRDIRSATSITAGSSTFGSSPGVLTIVSTSNGVSTTTRFYLDNGVLKVNINDSYYGPLTSSHAVVTNLIFENISNDISSAIKIDLSIQGTIGNVTRNKTYHNTVILKGSI